MFRAAPVERGVSMGTVGIQPKQQRATPRVSRRRVAIVALSAFVGVMLVWLVVSCPYSRTIGISDNCTSYGVLRWIQVTAPNEQHGIAAVLPIGMAGYCEMYPLSGIASAISALTIAWCVFAYARRELVNLSPRWCCQRCGHVVGGSSHLNVCPECGDLPNRRKDAWAVWR
jgi:hypothetical protein